MFRLMMALSATLLLASGTAANARPFAIGDLLRQQQFGAAATDPTGRWLVFERTDSYDTARRYDVIQWLMIQLTGVGPTFGQVVHFTRFAPPGNDYSVSRHRTEMLRLYDVLETVAARSLAIP